MAIVKTHGQKHAGQAAHAPDQLALVKTGKGQAVFQPRAAGGVQIAHAQKIEQEHAGQQAPVDVAEQAFIHVTPGETSRIDLYIGNFEHKLHLSGHIFQRIMGQ